MNNSPFPFPEPGSDMEEIKSSPVYNLENFSSTPGDLEEQNVPSPILPINPTKKKKPEISKFNFKSNKVSITPNKLPPSKIFKAQPMVFPFRFKIDTRKDSNDTIGQYFAEN